MGFFNRLSYEEHTLPTKDIVDAVGACRLILSTVLQSGILGANITS